MSTEVQKGPEKKESQVPSREALEKSVKTSQKKPQEVAKAIKKDPQLGILSGMWKGVKEGASSSWDGTKAVFTGTGEFIGVGAAKLVHEGGDSFMQYADEKTKVVRDVVNIAGEAIAITAFEAVNGDQSVIQGAIDYWKGKGVEFGKLPATKQAELLTNFATQVAIGVIGAKGLGAASKTATLGKTMEFTSKTGQTLGKIGSGISTVGVEVAGLDSGAMKNKKPHLETKHTQPEARIQGKTTGDTSLSKAPISPTAETMKTFPKPASHNPDERLPMGSTTGDMSLSKEHTDHVIEVIKNPHQLRMEASNLAREYMGKTALIERGGKLEVCQVLRVTENGKVLVQFPHNGVMSSKTVDVMDFKKLNNPEGLMDSRMTTKLLREQGRVETMLEKDGLDAFALSIEKKGLHFSNFSDDVPASLKSENPLAWINKDGTISYNKGKLETKFHVKITGDLGEMKINGDTIRDYVKKHPENGKAFMEELKNLKGHESTHRVLEASGIERISVKNKNGIDRIYGQEEICHIVDGSMSISKEDLKLLEQALQQRLGKNFKLDSHSLRIEDTKNVAHHSSETFHRVKEAASGSAEKTVAEIKSVVNSGDFHTQYDFLKHATPKEIEAAFNQGFLDRAADEFSPDFLNTLEEITQNTNATHLSLTKGISPEEKAILESIVLKKSPVDFKKSFQSITQASELSASINSLPESLSKVEGLDILKNSIARLAISAESQKDCLTAINTFVKRFPGSTHEGLLLAIEHTDPKLWKDSAIFRTEGELKGISLDGKEFEQLLQRMMKSNPDRFNELVMYGTEGNDVLMIILSKAANRIKPFDINKFRYTFAIGDVKDITSEIDRLRITDDYRLEALLGEASDTRTLASPAIAHRVGTENMDRFFFGSLQRLIERAENNTSLQDKIKQVLQNYDRDSSGHTNSWAKEEQILRREG